MIWLATQRDSLPLGPLDCRIASMARDAHSGVQVGQWFQQNRIAWEVMDLTSANSIPHVQISMVGNPTECKLISVTTLHEGYDPLPE